MRENKIERQRRERNDHLHERERGAQRVPVERRLCHGMSCQVRTRAEHGKGTDAAGHPYRKCANRRRDRLDAGRRYPRAPTGRNDRRRQHGRPGLHRGDLSAAASPASVDLGVRSRATAVGREMVRRLSHDRLSIPHETLLPHDVIWRARLAELTVFSLLSRLARLSINIFKKSTDRCR